MNSGLQELHQAGNVSRVSIDQSAWHLMHEFESDPIYFMTPYTLTSVIAISVVSLIACNAWDRDGRDLLLESQLIRSLDDAKKNQVPAQLDLNEIFRKPWIKSCFQNPYLEEAQFENGIGIQVDSYEYIADDFYVLWVFYEDGRKKWAKVHRMDVMDRDSTIGPSCTVPSSPWLYAVRRSGKFQYHF